MNHDLPAYLSWQYDTLHADGVSCLQLAQHYGTPCHVYMQHALLDNYTAYTTALAAIPHRISYAVKANDHIAILKLLANHNAGFDIVSEGELQRVLHGDGCAEKITFSGVGKSNAELSQALLANIGCFNIESSSELHRLQQLAAECNRTANIALRVNPNVNAKTHPYISTGLYEHKFGIPCEQAMTLYREAHRLDNINCCGIACHIGSQLCELSALLQAAQQLITMADQLRAEHIPISHIDIGGGLGVRYQQETPPSITEYCQALLPLFTEQPYQLHLEPGRSLIAQAGILLTRVICLKSNGVKHFAVIDAAMTDLLRPALYQANHRIIATQHTPHTPTQNYDVVGPVCESADIFAKNLPLAIKEGDLLAILTTGAYGRVLRSHYNSRAFCAEAMVAGNEHQAISHHAPLDYWLAHERCWQQSPT